MSTAIDQATTPGADQRDTPESGWVRALHQLDDWCERFGDALNPIVVKETRQALKSRQFVVTFSLLLLAALGWTIAGSLSMMPDIYTSPSAPRMMIGYYVVLAIPMLLVVPLAAYRSLEGEIDDGTLEMLSITTLSPWQIVLGKLSGASLQMLLYFVTLFPCLAFAYSLRGVDLPTTLLVVGALAVVGLFLTVAGLFFAPLARARTNRVFTMLVLIFLLVLAEYILGMVVIGMLLYGNPLSNAELVFAVLGVALTAISLGHLMLTATAAQLTPETENRSTGVRLSLLAFTVVVVSLIALGVLTLPEDAGLGVFASGSLVIAAIWTFCGAMMVSERSTITPRIQRELPNSFLSRMLWTWLTPGPSTGLVFVVVAIGTLTVMHQQAIEWMADSGTLSRINARQLKRYLGQPAVLYASYLICYLSVVRLLMFGVRLKNNPRVEVGLAALVVVAIMSALIPYSMQLHYNDYQPIQFDPIWQTTNWVFALGASMDQGVSQAFLDKIVGASIGVATIGVLSAAPLTRPRRTATPDRVAEELAKD